MKQLGEFGTERVGDQVLLARRQRGRSKMTEKPTHEVRSTRDRTGHRAQEANLALQSTQ